MNGRDVMMGQLVRRIESLLEQNRLLVEHNMLYREQIAKLEKNSASSSKPPSSDIFHSTIDVNSKKKKYQRGEQKGHPRHTREPFTADQIDGNDRLQGVHLEVRCRRLVALSQTEFPSSTAYICNEPGIDGAAAENVLAFCLAQNAPKGQTLTDSKPERSGFNCA
jgi:hypothetical protein